MSKAIKINEGGMSRQFGDVKRLWTRQNGSDELLPWVPETDRGLKTRTIDKNGIYVAENEGTYAWSSVTVNVPDNISVTGKGRDGKQHAITKNPQTGELVDTLVPSSIVVEYPPTTPYGIYNDGQPIVKVGMVVKAYMEDGTIWEDENHPEGYIPNNELSIFPSEAIYNPETDKPAGIATYEGRSCLYTMPSVAYGAFGATSWEKAANTYGYYSVSGSAPIYAVNVSDDGVDILVISARPFSGTRVGYNGRTEQVVSSEFTDMSGITYYSAEGPIFGSWYTNSEWYPPYCGMNETDVAWCLLRGEVGPIVFGSRIPVKVSWVRPGDNAILYTTFEIIVAPPYSFDDNSFGGD